MARSSQVFCVTGSLLLIVTAVFHGTGIAELDDALTRSHAPEFLEGAIAGDDRGQITRTIEDQTVLGLDVADILLPDAAAGVDRAGDGGRFGARNIRCSVECRARDESRSPAIEKEKTALKKPSQEPLCPCATEGLRVVGGLYQ